MNPFEKKSDPLNGSLLNFIRTNSGKTFDRFNPINHYVEQIKDNGAWNYAQVLTGPIAPRVQIADSYDGMEMDNFACSDYLGLAQHPEITRAALKCVRDYGVHASASPTLTGNTSIGKALESALSGVLKKDVALIYTTGWAANYGAITGLANRDADHFFIDAHAHNCLRSAVESVKGRDFQSFRHNDCDALEAGLKKCRQGDAVNGIFIVIDSLYSMKSAAPDLPKIMQLANEYEAFVILDVAHDFAAIGKHGLGMLESIDLGDSERLIISGCFSKSLGANGGFVAGCQAIYHQIMLFSPTYLFSTGIDPIPCAVAKRALEIAFSPEGDLLRNQLMSNCDYIHEKFTGEGFKILGNVRSAIVPVLIGDEKIARLATRFLLDHGILVNRAEFPAVGRREAILRFSLMSTHEKWQIDRATDLLKSAWEFAHEELNVEMA